MPVADGPFEKAAPNTGQRSTTRVAKILCRDPNLRRSCIIASVRQHLGQLPIRLRPETARLKRKPLQTCSCVDGRARTEVIVCQIVDQKVAGLWPALPVIEQNADPSVAKIEYCTIVKLDILPQETGRSYTDAMNP